MTAPEPRRRAPLVRYADETEAMACPYGVVRRIVTGGEGGVANVHVVSVEQGDPHAHQGYDEVYWVVSGQGYIELDGRTFELRTGTVAVIPAGTVHSVRATRGQQLEFVILGIPPVPITDDRARPMRSGAGGCQPGESRAV